MLDSKYSKSPHKDKIEMYRNAVYRSLLYAQVLENKLNDFLLDINQEELDVLTLGLKISRIASKKILEEDIIQRLYNIKEERNHFVHEGVFELGEKIEAEIYLTLNDCNSILSPEDILEMRSFAAKSAKFQAEIKDLMRLLDKKVARSF